MRWAKEIYNKWNGSEMVEEEDLRAKSCEALQGAAHTARSTTGHYDWGRVPTGARPRVASALA